MFLDTSYPSMTGQNISVPAGGDLQGAINTAQPGDTILLQPGATYLGTFTLPVKIGTGWIVIRTAAPDSSLPPAGTRITPAYASVLPKIVTNSVGPAIQTAAGAHGFRFTGVEITMAVAVNNNLGLVLVGDGSSAQNSLAAVPYDLVLDRVYVHGWPARGLRRGVALNCASGAVIDSYISEAHQLGADTQAIAAWNGPGPFKIVNNYLEGAAENVMFGGADPKIPNLVPSDIEVRRNHFFKPLHWKIGHSSYAGTPWQVKNLFELKNARRVLIDGNVFEHNWPQAQNGFAILMTVRNQDGTAPWSVIEDVTFTNNIVRHVASAMNILGRDDTRPSENAKRILIKNNLFDDVNTTNWGGAGRLFQILGGPIPGGTVDLVIDHNTAFHTGDILAADGAPHTRFFYTNNLTPHNVFGVGGTGTYGNPLLTLMTFFPGYTFVKNILVGGNPVSYPPDNFFPATLADVRFVDLAGGNYRLRSDSPYRNAGTDGKDIGVDFDALEAANPPMIDAPSMFSARATNTSEVVFSWLPVSGATSYEVYRVSLNGAFTLVVSTAATSAVDSGRSANTTYFYKIRAIGSGGPSVFSEVDAATTIVFTDTSLVGALIRAIDVTELRTAVNDVRAAVALPAATFTDSDLLGMYIKRVHISELRTFLDEARSIMALSTIPYTDPTIVAGLTTVKAAHIQELRDGTQ